MDVIGKNWSHRLQGMDHYWFTDEAFGMYNTTDQYDKNSRQSVYYRVKGDGYVDMGDVHPSPAIMKYDGIMLPDDIAKEYGLL